MKRPPRDLLQSVSRPDLPDLPARGLELYPRPPASLTEEELLRAYGYAVDITSATGIRDVLADRLTAETLRARLAAATGDALPVRPDTLEDPPAADDAAAPALEG